MYGTSTLDISTMQAGIEAQRPQSHLDAVVSRLGGATNDLRMLEQMASSLTDRLYGPQPEKNGADSLEKPREVRCGAHGALMDHCDNIDAVTDRLRVALERLAAFA